MNIHDTRMVPFLVFGIVACLLVATYTWFNTQTRGRRLFAIAAYSSCFWMLGDVIGRSSSTFNVKYVAEIVRYFGVVNVPVWMFAFTRAYCGRTMSRRTLQLLFVIPAISFGLMATSLWQHLFFLALEPASYGLSTPFGPYFLYVHMPYCYLLTILSIALVLNEMGRVPAQFRRQFFVLFVALCVPFTINIGGMLGWLTGYYNTALSYPVCALLIAFGMFRHRLMSVNPIAYESVFLNVRDGVIILSRDDVILDINATAASHTGKLRTELIGTPLAETFSGWSELVDKLRSKDQISSEFSDAREQPAGHYSIHTANLVGIDNEFDGRVVTLRDITANKLHQESLEALAYLDSLTRLANRRRFQEEIEKALQRAARRDELFAILYFDLNKFKAVNDSLGHEAGDELLKQVGARASSLLRAPDFVARVGGDEFVILLHNAVPTDLSTVVARLIAHVERPVDVNGHTLTPQLSMGAAFYPRDGQDVETLMSHADAAMYRAKASGGGLAA